MKRKFAVRLWLVVIATFAMLNIIVYQYIRAFYEEKGYDYYQSANQRNTLDLQSRILAYNDLIELPAMTSIGVYMLNLESAYGTTFDEIYYIVNDTHDVTSDGRVLNPLLMDDFILEGISIEKESNVYTNATYTDANVYFKHSISVFTFIFTKKLNTLLVNENVVIFKDDGNMVYSSVDYGSQYYTMLENSNSLFYANNFRDQLRSEHSIITGGNILGRSNIIAATEISQDSQFVNRFYLANITTRTSFILTYRPLFYLTIAEAIVYLLIVTFVVIYATYGIARSNDDYFYDLKSSKENNIFYLTFNAKGKLVNSNQTFKKRIKTYKTLKRVENFVDSENRPLSLQKLVKSQAVDLKFIAGNGSELIVRGTILRKRDYTIIFGEDITNQYSSIDRIRRLAFRHPITKLLNLHGLEDEINELTKENKTYALVAFDIQNFRNVNRLFGRSNGDTILIEVSKRLQQVFTNLFHIEGDLFVAVLNVVTKREDVEGIYREVKEQFRTPLTLNESKFEIDFRLGILLNEGKIEFKDAYVNLMQALKTAKGNTAQKYVIYDINIGQKLSREIILENNLRNALANDEFEVYFQPQLNMTTNKIIAFETLIRWHNPNYIGESPQLFIELAEKNNLIIQIGRFVLEEALKVAKILEPYGIKISINVSPIQIFQSGYVQEVTNMLEKYHLDRQTIALELTETMLMESFGEIVSKLESLRENGFSIHLDDFGEGYSSFAYLKNLPVDALKISYNFTKNIVTDKSAALIVKEMISLAKNFDKNIVCEGIETEAHAKIVSRFGCDYIQGFWISRPVKFQEAKLLLKKYNDIDLP